MQAVNFNVDYGDLSVDAPTLPTSDQEVVQAIHTLLKTEFGDYRLRPEFGIDFQKWIGSPISTVLADSIKNELLARLNSNPKIRERKLEIPYIINKNTIVFRIILKGIDSIDFSFVKDKGVKVLR